MIKYIKRKISSFKYNFEFLKVFNSPLKLPRLKFYFGEIKVGTPHFLPRKWVKITPSEAVEKATKIINKNPRPFFYKDKDFNQIYESQKNLQKPVTKTFGFDFVTLGWKTKWGQFRHEWNPLISFVGFGKQFVIFLLPPKSAKDCDFAYWEAWLYYDGTKGNRIERTKEMLKKYSCTWVHYEDGEKVTNNYYYNILKKKYLHLIPKDNEIS